MNPKFGIFLGIVIISFLIYSIIVINGILKKRKELATIIKLSNDILDLTYRKIEEQVSNISDYEFEKNTFRDFRIMSSIKSNEFELFDFEIQKLVVKLVGNVITTEELYELKKYFEVFLFGIKTGNIK